MPVIRYGDLRSMVKEIFQGSGSENAEADLVAEYLVRANLCGVDSHGVIRVPDYVQMVEAGTLKPNVQPKVVSERGATARLDAGFGYGQVSGKFAMELAIRKAKEYGTGTVVVFNGNHVGRVADYPALAASEDMIGVMMVKAYGELVAPWGGRKGLLATSPISFAIPTGTHGQIVGDFATSASAEGKVRVRQARGEKVPTGWLLDSQGKPTVEPDDLYNGGSLLTFGQWKGYALNLLMEATGGALSGAGVLDAFTGLNGVFAQAVDISFFSEVGEFKSRMDTMVEKILRSPPADGVKEVLIPGDPEAREMEKRKVNGIPVEERTWARLVDVARKYGVDVPRVG